MTPLGRAVRQVRNAWQWTYDPPTVETLTSASPSNTSRVGTATSERGLQLTVSYACVRLRAETIAGLPMHAVEYDGAKREIRDPSPWMERPNAETSPFELIEAWVGSIDVDGNAFSWVDLDNLGRVAEIWPLDPTKCAVKRDPSKAAVNRNPRRYEIDGQAVPELNVAAKRSGIMHIKGFGGAARLRGINPVQWHMHALGLAIAAEEYGESFFVNGTVMQGVIETPGNPPIPKLREMRDSFAESHAGPRNAHKPGFLFGGAQWKQMQLPNDQAQFLETRRFQAEEVCRIWRVPPHKVGILDRATFSNIEHQGIEWANDGVAPYTQRITSAVLAYGLMPMGQRLKFNLAGLSRGDLKAQAEAYAIGRQWGWYSVNDVLRKLDENDIGEKGDVYLQPLNMIPAGWTLPAGDDAAAANAVVDFVARAEAAGLSRSQIIDLINAGRESAELTETTA